MLVNPFFGPNYVVLIALSLINIQKHITCVVFIDNVDVHINRSKHRRHDSPVAPESGHCIRHILKSLPLRKLEEKISRWKYICKASKRKELG